jgi:Trk K+ transport system NAD-binding subunit
VNPEEETAFSVSSVLQLKNALKITELDHENVIAELYIPRKYVGHSLESINIEKRFGLKFIAIKTSTVSQKSIAVLPQKSKTYFYYDNQVPLGAQDILIVAGKLNDIRKFTGE